MANVNVTRTVLALALFFRGSAQWAIATDCLVLVLAHCVERGKVLTYDVSLNHTAGLGVLGTFGKTSDD